MKIIWTLLWSLALASNIGAQPATLPPIDTGRYQPMPLPQVTASATSDGPGKLIRYNLTTAAFDTTDIPAALPDVIIVQPPSQSATQPDLNGTGMKVAGFSALQPADMIQGFPNYPFSAIVKLYITFKDPVTSQLQYVTCSGAMINKEYAITAGHCVYNTQTGSWASQITVVPAYNMSTAPYGSTPGISWNAFTGYTQGHDWNYDVAIVRTATPIGNATGWLGWGSNMNNSFFTSAANIESSIGYPAQDDNNNPVFEQGERMYAWNGYLDYWEGTNSVCHYNQGFHGQSGSALYYKNTTVNDRFVYGVLSHGAPNPYHTCHCRIDNSMASALAGIIAASPSGIRTSGVKQILTYPSPATRFVTVDFGTLKFRTGIIGIRNLVGALVQQITINGTQQVNMDLSQLPEGTYLLSATLDGRQYQGKITKVP